MPTKAKSADGFVISIPVINEQHLSVRIVGETPLVVHNWSVKAKQQMLDVMMQKAKTKKHDAKNPVEDFIESLYWLEGKPEEYTEEAFAAAIKNGARFCFPSTAFKAAAVSAGYRAGLTKDKVSTNGSFHISGDMVEIYGTPVMREDMVRVANGAPDIRYRGMFPEWEAEISLSYNANVISAEQLVNLINYGGYACGIGERRPEKGGDWGRYHVLSV
jgi:hypothetical protein